MVYFSIQILLISTITLLLTGCASVPLQTVPPSKNFSTATFVPTITPLFTATPQTQPNTPIPAATQFCMGIISSWSCACGELFSPHIEIKRADTSGQCNVYMLNAYSITLPDEWYCSVAGVFGSNLSCLTGLGQRIFVRSVNSEIPIEEADQAIQTIQEGEGIFTDPVVEKDEEKITRELKEFQGTQVLTLLSQKEDLFILRYFIKNGDRLYVFAVESKDKSEIDGLTSILEGAVQSMKFVQ